MKGLFLCLVIVLCLAVSGCAKPATRTITTGSPITDNLVASIKEGVTTKSELMAKLGQPFSATRMPDGSEMIMWSKSETIQRGGVEFNMFSPNPYAFKVNSTVLNVTFTSDGIVKMFTQSTSTVGDQPVTIKTEPVVQ